MHMAEKIDVAEVSGVVARLVLAEIVSEEHVQLVPLSDDDEPHEARPLATDRFNDVVDSPGHGSVQNFQTSLVNVDLGSAPNAENFSNLEKQNKNRE